MSLKAKMGNLSAGDTFAGGNYTLLRLLGVGGMGFVWEAEKQGMEGFSKTVALKMLVTDEHQEEARRLFLNEARNSALLHHPNIVEIYDLGQDGTIPYIAMERINGKSFEDILEVIEQRGEYGIPWQIAAALIVEVCKGLQYAHVQKDKTGAPMGLIHRDMKPGNLLLTADGFVKIIDFGIAKSQLNQGKTRTGRIIGTPGYMSPEQIQSAPLDPRSDIFGVGAVLYELCCGYPPFHGDTVMSIIHGIINDEPSSIVDLHPQIPKELEAIIFRCLSKKREERFDTAKQVQRALEDLLLMRGQRIDPDELADFLGDLKWEGDPSIGTPTLRQTLPYHMQDPTEEEEDFIQAAIADALMHDTSRATVAENPIAIERVDTPLPLESVYPPETEDEIQKLPHTSIKEPPSTSELLMFALLVFGGVALASIGFGVWYAQAPKRSAGAPKAARKAPPAAIQRPAARQRSASLQRSPVLPARLAVASPRAPLAAVEPRPRDPRPMARNAAPPLRRPSKAAPIRRRPRRKRKRVAAARRRAASPASRRKKARRKAPPKARGRGYAVLLIRPSCKLFLGDRALGSSGPHSIALPAGRHRIRCINFPKHFVREFSVPVQPNKTFRVVQNFRQGSLFIAAFPASHLFLRAKGQNFGLIGRSHEPIKLYEGEYRLVIIHQKDPKRRRELILRIRAGKMFHMKVIW